MSEAEKLLKILTMLEIKAECLKRGEDFNPEAFEQSYATMIASPQGPKALAVAQKYIDQVDGELA